MRRNPVAPCPECQFAPLGIGEIPCKTCEDGNEWKPATTYTVNLTDRLEPYNVTYGPESVELPCEPDLRTELIETNLRYIAAVLAADRVPAVTRPEVGKRIERCLELLR